jgi:hypothetical protein
MEPLYLRKTSKKEPEAPETGTPPALQMYKTLFELQTNTIQKMKQHVKAVSVPPYYRGVLVFIGSPDQLRDYLRRSYPAYATSMEDIDIPQAVACTFNLECDALIYSPSVPKEAAMIHEIFHAARHILNIVGIDLSDDTEEAYAYLIEYLSDQILPWLRTFSCESL